MNANEIKSISMLINEAKESAKMQRDLITDDLESMGIKVDILEELVKNQSGDFELTDEAVSEYLEKITTSDADVEEGKEKEFVQYAIDSIKDLIDTDEDLADLEDEADGEIKSYTDYICSEEYDNHRKNNIKIWKTMLEREENPAKARKLRKAIYIAENRYTLEFMFERLDNVETHTKEKSAMVESFFNNSRSNYVLTKFGAKCEQFGFSKDLYKYLLDLEERYLEEKYHVYNNFFLFTAIRFIGHCGTEEINEAKEIVQCMLNLVYNRFYSDDVKGIFLTTIRTFLDQFEDVRDTFNEKNILHPNHPYRIQKEKERDATLRAKLYGEMQTKLGIKLEDVKEDLDAMGIPELVKYYEEKKTEKEATEKAGAESDSDGITSDEDNEEADTDNTEATTDHNEESDNDCSPVED